MKRNLIKTLYLSLFLLTTLALLINACSKQTTAQASKADLIKKQVSQWEMECNQSEHMLTPVNKVQDRKRITAHRLL